MCAVGAGQNGVVAVHNGLNFALGVGQAACDGGAVERAVDGGDVARVHTGDTGRIEHASAQCRVGGVARCGQVVLSGVLDLSESGVDAIDGRVDDGLQLALRVNVGIRRPRFNGRLHGPQVGWGDAGDAQRGEVVLAQGLGLHGCAASCGHDARCRISNALQLAHGVHFAVGGQIDHAVHQGQRAASRRGCTGHAGDADCGVGVPNQRC